MDGLITRRQHQIRWADLAPLASSLQYLRVDECAIDGPCNVVFSNLVEMDLEDASFLVFAWDSLPFAPCFPKLERLFFYLKKPFSFHHLCFHVPQLRKRKINVERDAWADAGFDLFDWNADPEFANFLCSGSLESISVSVPVSR